MLPITLLALTACRFEDLEHIDLKRVQNLQPVIITQGKTGTERQLPNLHQFFNGQFNSLDPTAKIVHHGYDSVRRDIRDAVSNRVKKILLKSHDCTHIFRHLRASYLKACGWPNEMIQEYFVHQKVSATAEYIHEELVEIFQSNLKT